MAESFIILTSARSGSTWLVDTINRHPDLSAFGERFNPGSSGLCPGRDTGFCEIGRIFPGPAAFPAFRYIRRYYPANLPRGFKLLYGQARHFPETILSITLRRDRIVHLVRRNQLNVLISLQIVYTHLKRWRLLKTENPPEKTMQIELNPDTIVSELQRKYEIIDMARRYLRWLRMPNVEIFYEDLVGGPDAFNPVWDFLEVERPEDLGKTSYKKVQTRSHCEVISNYDAVRKALAGSPYADLLEQ